jgi:hypothetical protein
MPTSHETLNEIVEAGKPSYDHSNRTTKLFVPLLGYCICKHCVRLPCWPDPDEARELAELVSGNPH